MLQFFETMMGRDFYQGNIPKLIKALVKIADELEKLNKHLEEQNKPKVIGHCMFCERKDDQCECEFSEDGRPYLKCLGCRESIEKNCKC